MDKIYIKDLEVYAFHGVNKEEKNMGQKFLISIEISLSLREAGKTDNLNATVNYAKLCHDIEREFTKESYNLIEKSAEALANFILLNYYQAEGVKVLVKKPWAPIGKSLDYAAVEIERYWHKAYIGLGSNMGDKEENIKKALEYINTDKCRVEKVSNIYNTKPVGYLDQDEFLNCAAEIKTLLTPEELIRFLLNIEKELKRERIIKWGPRTIDLDVLLYDDIITSSEEITVPHPRMHERLFVLKPLSDIAPYLIHPILNKRIISLEEELSKVQNL
ncbi:dihydroneopterin aldolase / 2-amino-4-hydroxy-6-hydroxymethyldihydropteridine diphosphokinase [Clostridium sp. USBA 49]|jgi:dihydroneopterin aldolase/2-amino-4-hydroxy-6-hydroxymethyldihydropteridine diphosphokinase|uniref:2-amino-4-hydroxy-6- hydroxymethyldihydropteridine diphosphokinase n=1 Tax=Clostridium sp. USBA 49 TaxID=1881060 RepID=UPI0009997677|nr:2-amino-4-hydroxy-6-hydroxymethyldihydropteridine diphosphokinase [Clostridium sp. USBA 49]SKA87634.1 dihydroneopterin aldolase / 2-amino-4-hydroxy-6-hydroxymethyldihydropteridine diphosphokinase [Clostridium sp. USBA 49]